MSRKPWTKSIGEYGNRVRLYEARIGGPIMRAVWINGKEDRKSLGHRDKKLAVEQAYKLHEALLTSEDALRHESMTIGMLIDRYTTSSTHRAKVTEPFSSCVSS